MSVAKHVRSNVVGYLALVIALSGTAYAATSLPANSVGTKQLKNKAVTLKKISPRAQAALKGKRGLTGPRGPAGPQGIPGPSGTRVMSASVSLTAATGLGTTKPLLTVGPVTYTANCLDNTGGNFRVEIRAQSGQPGLSLFSRNGVIDLSATPQEIWFAQGTDSQFSFSQRHLIRSPTATLQWADVSLAIHKAGYGDCLAGIDVTTPG